jgi:hypothetical protein
LSSRKATAARAANDGAARAATQSSRHAGLLIAFFPFLFKVFSVNFPASFVCSVTVEALITWTACHHVQRCGAFGQLFFLFRKKHSAGAPISIRL